MAVARRRKKACCSACAAGRRRFGAEAHRRPAQTPISRMSDAQLRRFTSRDPNRLRGVALRRWLSAKIRLLRHEDYGRAQSAAIAYRMAGIARPRTTTSRPAQRRRTTRRR